MILFHEANISRPGCALVGVVYRLGAASGKIEGTADQLGTDVGRAIAANRQEGVGGSGRVQSRGDLTFGGQDLH